MQVINFNNTVLLNEIYLENYLFADMQLNRKEIRRVS